MFTHPVGLDHRIERCRGPFGGPRGDHVGHRFEGAAVIRHETHPSPELADLLDPGRSEEGGKGGHRTMIAACAPYSDVDARVDGPGNDRTRPHG